MRRLFNIFAISAIMVCFSCGQATNKQKEQQEADAFAEFNKQIEQEEQQKKQQEDDHEKSLYGYWKDSNGIIELFLNADLMFCVVDKELIYRGGWSVNYTGGVDADLSDAYNGGLYFTAINEGTYTSLTPADINIKLRKDSSKKKISWSRTSNRTLNDAIDAYNEKVTQNARGCQSTSNNDYSWINGKWNMSRTYENGGWYTTNFVDLHIDYNRGTIKVYLAENDNSINTTVNGIQYQLMYSGNFDIDPYSNSIICGRFSFKLDTNKRRIYQNIEGSKTYFSKGSGMNKNYGDSWFD